MTSETVLGLTFATASAVAFNASYLLQFKGSAHAPAVTLRRPLASLRGLARRRVWLAGTLLGAAGMVLFWLALAGAPLSLVQTFVTGGLIFCVPMAIRGLHHRVNRTEKIGVVVMAAALAALTIGVGRTIGRTPDVLPTVGFVLGCCLAAAGLATLPAIRRGEALGLASGILFAAADLSTKVLTEQHSLLTSPWLVPVVVCNVAAFFAFSRALQIGRALPVIALMTAGTNVVSIAGAVGLLGDSLGSGPLLGTAHVIAFAAVGLGAWLLAPVQTALNAPAAAAPATV